MTNEIVHVPFHGDTILTVDLDGEPHVLLKPVLDRLGVDYWSQIEKLRRRSWAAPSTSQVQVPGDSQRRTHTVVDVRTFLMLLATIDENRVADGVRSQLIAYQAESADAIYDYWNRGVAIRQPEVVPAPREPSSIDAIRAMLDQIEVAQQRAARAEEIAIESARSAVDTSARLDAIEGRHDWYAALGYAKLHGLPTSTTYLARLGREASAVGGEHGVEANRVQHALYGQVNQWPEWVWDEALERRRATS